MCDKKFWDEAWKKQDTPWFQPEQDRHFFNNYQKICKKFLLSKKLDCFIPLCGTSLAINFLYSKGHNIWGVDLSDLALKRLKNDYKELKGERVNLIEKDIFDFEPNQKFDLIYDRAALIALNPNKRKKYCNLLTSWLKTKGAIVIETINFQAKNYQGPPFPISSSETRKLFSKLKTKNLVETKLYKISPRLADLGVKVIEQSLDIFY